MQGVGERFMALVSSAKRHVQITRGRLSIAILAFIGLVAPGAIGQASGAVIPVTTVEQKISETGGCSLQEAIFSANFDQNVAISGYTLLFPRQPIFITTQCVPGSGDDIIVLPAAATLSFSKVIDDAINPTGPTANPIIASRMTILAFGATLQRVGTVNFRLFAVGTTGHLTLTRAHVKGFRARGGDGGPGGGGGGLGAGGAIYVVIGGLVVEASTFEGNVATGGRGSGPWGGDSSQRGGGGGGLGGNGGSGACGDGLDSGFGGGGGGARSDGGAGSCGAGGGGGTVSEGGFDFDAGSFRGGFECGGHGGTRDHLDGFDATCSGGGGGGGSLSDTGAFSGDGGNGSYGGGGGGGGDGGGFGGHAGFGGGGGGGWAGTLGGADGGNGGFGGGGGPGPGGAITGGDPGNGGMFAGHGNSRNGGGGAGLGGAIFNDRGNVFVRNSTFTDNSATRGFGGEAGRSNAGQNGSDGGAAIASRNGHLTVINATISNNLLVAGTGGGLLVVQDSATAPTSLVLRNTILSNNGAKECSIVGFSVAASFAGNLITDNDNCGGVVTTSDPQLGPLQWNQGPTPTRAIGTGSPARDMADAATSPTVDQRGQDRPAGLAFDIGAFELCLKGPPVLEFPCLITGGIATGDDVQLTVQVAPAGGGVTVPPVGTHTVEEDSVVALRATPNPGFRFTQWSPNVTDAGDPTTTVFMNQSQIVTANFAACDCAVDVTGRIGLTFGGFTLNPVTKRYVQTVTLRNNSATPIAGPVSLVLDGLSTNATLFNPTGTTLLMLPAGSPYVDTGVTLAPGQSVAIVLQFTNPSNDVITYEARVLAGAGAR